MISKNKPVTVFEAQPNFTNGLYIKWAWKPWKTQQNSKKQTDPKTRTLWYLFYQKSSEPAASVQFN